MGEAVCGPELDAVLAEISSAHPNAERLPHWLRIEADVLARHPARLAFSTRVEGDRLIARPTARLITFLGWLRVFGATVRPEV